MKGGLSDVGQDATTVMGVKGPSGRTLLLHSNQGTLMNITILKHFMERETTSKKLAQSRSKSG